jgi:predicted DCC family thiol-disulfide oxidoreductase YuxK
MKAWLDRWVAKAPFRYSPYQFAAFRTVLGAYLAWHFAWLVPWATEMFSSKGVLPDAKVMPSYGYFPNVLFWVDTPAFATTFLAFLSMVALAFAAGVRRRWAALVLWYGWACLLGRQPFIANPGVPYIGLLLLLCAALPSGEPWSVTFGKAPERSPRDWEMPRFVYVGVWVLMAVGYTVSGLHKLESPSWRDGTAIGWLAANPLARDTFLRQILAAMPEWVIALETWGALALELFFAPLALFAATRKLVWLLMVMMHLGILCIVDFADLTIGVLMVHLFTFDERWLPAPRPGVSPIVVFYDGVCGLCDGFVQFVLEEDRAGAMKFATLQGDLAKQTLPPGAASAAVETIAVKTADGRILERSTGVLHVVRHMGGMWRVLGVLGFVCPRVVRDAAYRFVAGIRYQVFGKLEACRIPTPGERARFLG